jgi:hypothetical protein
MANQVVWSGLKEYRELLRNLPETLAIEAGHYAEAAANGFAVEVRQAYPRRTGNLRKGVKISRLNKGKYATGMVVKNTAPHAVLFENGTQARHTALGANRGSMPPGHVFVPRAIRTRRRLYDDVKGLLQRKGAIVTGDA